MLLHYLHEVNYESFLRKLGVANAKELIKSVKHFTEKEAERRDEIIRDYFGDVGIKSIVDTIVKNLRSLHRGSAVLDAGAGTGFFTIRIAEKLADLHMSFYALDATPAMLAVLIRRLHETKNTSITPLLGLAEKIVESAKLSQKAYRSLGVYVPTCFDSIISILMVHHCKNPQEVFLSMRSALKPKGKIIIVDLCEHPFKEFREEMGDVHLGFKLNYIKSELDKLFEVEAVEKMAESCRCEESGKSAELFVAVARKRSLKQDK